MTPGLAEPEGECYPGYYCEGGVDTPTPTSTICPVGNYCPEGSYIPIPCPEGTISSGEGNKNITDCKPCPPGRYCTPDSSQTGNTLPCYAGYVCTGGSSVPNPTDNIMGYICPEGNYCPNGTSIEIQCDKGSYAPRIGMGECDECPAGTTCPNKGMNVTVPCPSGFYCMANTTDNGEPCLPGSFNNLTGLTTASACQPCLAGMYCEMPGLTWPTGLCKAGYVCGGGAAVDEPGDDGLNGPCPTGHYCEAGTSNATACPRGTLNRNTHGAAVNDCRPCEPGFYCGSTGLDEPTGPCEERFYCPDDAAIDVPNPTDYPCPLGSSARRKRLTLWL
ncbi:uncharacterized protein K04H4.2-like isoform X2 [Ptychodera flava]|uniref:uncharacterized protein K04H4.2-like isoform X2 n=1 Tax=Ptychodera flava TaxID=63121 RepID=UPI003969EB29